MVVALRIKYATTVAAKSLRLPPMIYTLSNRQLKSLRQSGRPLTIYLPAPIDPPSDLLKWSALRLPDCCWNLLGFEAQRSARNGPEAHSMSLCKKNLFDLAG